MSRYEKVHTPDHLIDDRSSIGLKLFPQSYDPKSLYRISFTSFNKKKLNPVPNITCVSVPFYVSERVKRNYGETITTT